MRAREADSQRILDMASAHTQLEEEKALMVAKVQEYEEAQLCVVCLDKNRAVMFNPCGHLCCCAGCAQQMTTCPLDNAEIESKRDVFAFS